MQIPVAESETNPVALQPLQRKRWDCGNCDEHKQQPLAFDAIASVILSDWEVICNLEAAHWRFRILQMYISNILKLYTVQ